MFFGCALNTVTSSYPEPSARDSFPPVLPKAPQSAGIRSKKAQVRRRHPLTRCQMRRQTAIGAPHISGWHCAYDIVRSTSTNDATFSTRPRHLLCSSPPKVRVVGKISTAHSSECRLVFACLPHGCHATRHLAQGHR
ncbi:hypothetical protein MRX96_002988 [Rhipicephalus microplus]